MKKKYKELNDYEHEVLNVVGFGLTTKKGIDNIVTNNEILKGLKSIGHDIGIKRLRKIISVIRKYGLINFLIVNSKGYYVATSRDTFVKHLKDIKKREETYRELRIVMQKQLDIYDMDNPEEKRKQENK